jgi:hypothetical protein
MAIIFGFVAFAFFLSAAIAQSAWGVVIGGVPFLIALLLLRVHVLSARSADPEDGILEEWLATLERDLSVES